MSAAVGPRPKAGDRRGWARAGRAYTGATRGALREGRWEWGGEGGAVRRAGTRRGRVGCANTEELLGELLSLPQRADP